jgi:hypothetical protein
MSTVTITEKISYYINEDNLSDFHTETGYYVDLIYSDGSIDTYGPYDSEEESKSLGVY